MDFPALSAESLKQGHPVPKPWFLISFYSERNRAPWGNTASRARAGTYHMSLEHLIVSEDKEVLTKPQNSVLMTGQ